MTGSLLTSTSSRRVGSQEPRVRIVPPGDDRLGREVVDFMAEVGRPLDPWQADGVRAGFTVRPDGLWSAFELLELVSRQNGKGGVTEAIELGSMYLFREPLLMHSSHHFSTSRASFQRTVDIIDGSDWLRQRVKMVSRSKGDESIELTRAAGGARLWFVARTLRAGRGLTGSKNIFDEAAWLTVGQYAAQTPTLSTIPNPQIIYTSTPPDEDVGPLPEDAMLPSVRQRAMDGDSRVAMFEFSPTPGFDRTDLDVWYECNPALGIRITEEFLARQLEAFTKAGKPWKFDTEHLGAWPDDAAHQWLVIAEAEWSARERPKARMGSRVAFGVRVSPDRRHAAIGAAGRRANAKGRLVEVTSSGGIMDYRPGTGWVLPRLKELVAKHRPVAVVVGDRTLADEAVGEGLEVHLATGSEQASAAGMLYDGIVRAAGDVRHLGQHELSMSVAGAVKRKVGQGWDWDQSGPVDVCPVGAVSLALWGHTTRVPPPEPMIVVASRSRGGR